VPVFFQACGTPLGRNAVPGTPDSDLIADLQGDFDAQDLGHLVAVAVKVECRFRAGRLSFL